MDAKEKEFFEKLMVTFREEALEHIKNLSDGFLQLEKETSPEVNKHTIETIFREAHSLKGAARSVNHENILEICQVLETVLSLWKQNKITISSDSFDILHKTVDVISSAIAGQVEQRIISNAVEQLNLLLKNSSKPSTIEEKKLETAEKSLKEEKVEVSVPSTTSQSFQSRTIRISLDKINRLFLETEETQMIKVLFENQLNQIKQFRENGFTKQGLDNLIKNAQQNIHIVENTIDNLLEDLKKVLMQPMGILFEVLPHMVRDISRKLSKEIRIEFKGEDIEVDRRVLEEIKDPIIHLIRNSIDHGIELPSERAKHNKSSCGTIRITAEGSEGNHVKLSVADDGRGFDIIKVKEAALKRGVISEKQFETMSDDEVIKLAFRSEISTSPIVTELSGRGVGLDVVSEKVDKLGGYVNVTTVPNQGATFTLTLPLTLATFRGVYITVAGQKFIVPTHNIERVNRVNIADIKTTEHREIVILEGRSFSFVHLADLLEIQQETTPPKSKESLFALTLRAAEQTIVFGVDYVHSEQEILVKGIGKQHMRVKNIMAFTVAESGHVIPILNPVDLVNTAITKDMRLVLPGQQQEATLANKSILVVEDSITTRLMIKNILSSADYKVQTAVDGMEAFEILQNEVFDLIITDVEMPRMDGFTLVEKIRGMQGMEEVPVIICTALGSNQDRQRGIELGANAYLDKNTFNFQSLLGIVKKLIT